MRRFLAIALPHEVKTALLGDTPQLPGVKWTCPDQLHLTLRFLGDVPDEQRETLIAALHDIPMPPLELEFSHCGFFPGVFWYGLTENPPLRALKNTIDRRLNEFCAMPPEDREFKPHITLARLKGRPSRQLEPQLKIHCETITVPKFTATQFRLYSSVLDPAGVIHRVEAVFPA